MNLQLTSDIPTFSKFGFEKRVTLTLHHDYIWSDSRYTFKDGILYLDDFEVKGPIKLLLKSLNYQVNVIYFDRKVMINKKNGPAKINKDKVLWITRNKIHRLNGPAFFQKEDGLRSKRHDRYNYKSSDGKIKRYYIDNNPMYFTDYLKEVWKRRESFWSFSKDLVSILFS